MSSSTTATTSMPSTASARPLAPSSALAATGGISAPQPTPNTAASPSSPDTVSIATACSSASGNASSSTSDAATSQTQDTWHSLLRRWVDRVGEEKFTPKKVPEITVAAFAIFGVVWATFLGIPSLRLQKWSAANDFLQACLSLDTPSVRSTKCNESIQTGPVPPPKWKREEYENGLSVRAFVQDPATFSAAVLFTVALGVLTIIYFRPRMETFHPVISMARTGVCGIPHDIKSMRRLATLPSLPKRFGRWSGIQNGKPAGEATWTLVIEDHQILGHDQTSLDVDGSDTASDANFGDNLWHHDEEATLGQRIGVFYESDDETEELATHASTALPQPNWISRHRRPRTDLSCSISFTTLPEAQKTLHRLKKRRETLRAQSCSAIPRHVEESNERFETSRMSFMDEPEDSAGCYSPVSEMDSRDAGGLDDITRQTPSSRPPRRYSYTHFPEYVTKSLPTSRRPSRDSSVYSTESDADDAGDSSGAGESEDVVRPMLVHYGVLISPGLIPFLSSESDVSDVSDLDECQNITEPVSPQRRLSRHSSMNSSQSLPERIGQTRLPLQYSPPDGISDED